MPQATLSNREISPQEQSQRDLLAHSGTSGFYLVAACLLFIISEPLVRARLPVALIFLTLIFLSAGIRFYYYVTLPDRESFRLPLFYHLILFTNAAVWGVFCAWMISLDPEFGGFSSMVSTAAAASAAGAVFSMSMHKWLGLLVATLFSLPVLIYMSFIRQADIALLMSSLTGLYFIFLFNLSKRLFAAYWQALYAMNELQLKSGELELARNQAMEVNVALEAATRDAINANQAKTEFLTHMSHEIRTPLNGVIGMADMLATTQLDSRQHQYANTIQESGRLVVSLINDILDFSQINSGKTNIDLQPVSVSRLARDCLDMFQPLATKGSNTLMLQDNLPPNCLIKTDRLRLQQLLTNLLSNALKFTHNGIVTLELYLQKVDGKHTLTIAVRDSGIGIAQQDLDCIFEAFYQLRKPGQPAGTGTGLGLAICKKLVQLLNGEIKVESSPGQGSCFSFDLPVGPPDITSPAQTSPAPLVRHVSQKSCDLLVVEDNRVNQMVMEAFLEKLGYRFRIVVSGELALLAYAEMQPDLILMDLNLPDISGQELTRRIRAMEAASGGKHSIIIALTAHAYANVVRECLDLGMDDHLAKPVSLATLDNTLNQWLPGPETD